MTNKIIKRNRWFVIVIAAGVLLGTAAFTSSKIFASVEPDGKDAPIVQNDPHDEDIIAKKEADKGGPIIIQKDAPVETAIIGHYEDPIAMRTVNFQNGWTGIVGEEIWAVGTGALREDPDQGIVYIRKHNLDHSFISSEQIKAPEKHGSLKVTAFSSENLALQAQDGTEWNFSLKDYQLTQMK